MKNYLSLPIDSKISLVQPTYEMANILFDLVDSDREHLRPFLDFVDEVTGPESQTDYIAMKLNGYIKGTDCLFLISCEEQLVGSIDLHFIDKVKRKAEIGYWLHSSQTGKGIMGKCVKKVCEIGFQNLDLNKISLFADVENTASNNVAKKAGFEFVATEKQDLVMYGEFRDMNKYSLLKSDFYKI